MGSLSTFHHAHMHRLLRATRPLHNARLSSIAPRSQILFSASRTYAKMASAAETDTQAEIVANTSGITPDSLKATLKEKLQASHVDINDMSGEAPAFSPFSPPLPARLSPSSICCLSTFTFGSHLKISPRWLRTSFRSNDSITAIFRQDILSETSAREFGVEGGDCGNSCLDATVFDA